MSLSLRSALLAIAAGFLSQELIFADNLTGRVLDPQGQVVAGAQLRLFDRKSGELRKAVSSEEGTYSFEGISSGDYLIEGTASNAALIGSTDVSVSGESQTQALTLKISGTNTEVLVMASGTPLTI